MDPNAKTGPSGFGIGGYVTAAASLAYRIDYENESKATAPAQSVSVTDQLSAGLDWSTFELTEIAWGDQLLSIPPKTQYFETVVPMSNNGVDFEVWVYAGIDSKTGRLTARFYSIDPSTQLPPSVQTGFLPPEDGTGRGLGHISYTIKAKSGLASGTEIRNVALITFDRGETIATNQREPHNPAAGNDPAKEALVTIDSIAPTSQVLALATTVTNPRFTVFWQGSDNANGSGVREYTIYVSENSGAYIPLKTNTTSVSALFVGQTGRTYSFYSLARDNVGNQQAAPTVVVRTSVVGTTIFLPIIYR